MRRPSRGRTDDPWLPLAGALLIGGPFWHALVDGRYPFSQPEAWLLPAAAALGGVVAMWLARKLAEPWQTLAIAVIAACFVDLQFDLERHAGPAIRFGVVFLALVVVYRHRAQIVALALTAFYASSLVRPSPVRLGADHTPPRAQPPPLLIHLILDGHWSPAGFRSIGDTATARALTANYLDRGFTIVDPAYSRYAATRNSIGSSFSLGETVQIDELRVDRFRMRTNPYFRELSRRGYRVTGYQTTHLDFCTGAPEARCVTWHANAVGNVGRVPGRWWVRGQLALRYILAANLPWVNRIAQGRPGADDNRPSWRRSMAGGGLGVARAALDEISRTGGPGKAFVVHLLLTHAPLDVNAQCRGFDSVAERDAANDFGGGPATWAPHYRDEITCAQRVVDEFIRAADDVAGAPGNIIVVQGDHGPRLPGLPGSAPSTIARFDPTTMSSYFATLFAVRFASPAPGVVAAPLATQPMFWSLVATGLRTIDTTVVPHFVIDSPRSASSPRDTIIPLDETKMAWVTAGARRR